MRKLIFTAADGQAFDQGVRRVTQDVTVVAGARLALIRVADEVFLDRRVARHEAPLHAGREGRAAAAAQSRALHQVDDRIACRLVSQHLFPDVVAADLAVAVQFPGLVVLQRLEQQQVLFVCPFTHVMACGQTFHGVAATPEMQRRGTRRFGYLLISSRPIFCPVFGVSDTRGTRGRPSSWARRCRRRGTLLRSSGRCAGRACSR